MTRCSNHLSWLLSILSSQRSNSSILSLSWISESLTLSKAELNYLVVYTPKAHDQRRISLMKMILICLNSLGTWVRDPSPIQSRCSTLSLLRTISDSDVANGSFSRIKPQLESNLLLNRFNYQPDILLQYPGVDFPREAEQCEGWSAWLASYYWLWFKAADICLWGPALLHSVSGALSVCMCQTMPPAMQSASRKTLHQLRTGKIFPQ